MRMYFVVLITLIAISLLVDWYIFVQIKQFVNKLYKKILYWLPGIFFSLLFILIKINGSNSQTTSSEDFYISSWFLLAYYILYFPKIFYVIFDLINKLLCLVTRRKLKLFKYIGIFIAGSIVFLILQGTFFTRFDFQVRKVEIPFKDLPKSFDGFKIVQISDLHLGGWGKSYEMMDTVIKLIMQQEPDMIVMTGDMVNNFADEFKGWDKHFCCLQAPYGAYAILGNHDYGDYSQWVNQAAKDKNLVEIKQGIRNLGFTLLLDSCVQIKNETDSFALLGVQNWGHPPFPRYGNLKKTKVGSENNAFKILLSHDPNHWEDQIQNNKDIQLTLSGHTHGMQFGYDDGKHKFSPAQWIFHQWNGLYQNEHQYIYVNQGIGYVGAPFRIGIRPEITVITLKKAIE